MLTDRQAVHSWTRRLWAATNILAEIYVLFQNYFNQLQLYNVLIQNSTDIQRFYTP